LADNSHWQAAGRPLNFDLIVSKNPFSLKIPIKYRKIGDVSLLENGHDI
jgi:hypothetical protein